MKRRSPRARRCCARPVADPSFPTPDGAADEVAKTATLIWLNGTLSHGNALTSVRDRGLLLGDGLYETALVVNRRPLLWEQHLQRLLASAAALAFHLPDGFVSTVDAALDTFLAALPPNECWLRLTLTTGAGARGLSRPPAPAPTLLLQAAPYDRGVVQIHSAAVLDAPRVDPLDPLARHKTTSAMRWVLARQQAMDRGADCALVRTIHGDLVEADFANVFVVAGDSIATPALSRGALPGVTRAWALNRLRALGRYVVERTLEVDELAAADAVFLTSSLVGVTVLRRIDDRRLPAAAPTADLLAREYRRITD